MKQIGYHLKEGFLALFRNRLVNTAAIGMMVACLIVTGAFSLLVVNLNEAIDEVGAVNTISVYMDETCTEADCESAGSAIRAVSGVTDCVFISKAEGLESMRATFGDLLDGMEDDNPIRDSFRITVDSQEHLTAISAELQNVAGVAKVNSRGDVAATFLEVRNVLMMVGLVFVLILLLVSLFIISNAIRLSVYSRRTEIRVMKTVGATNGFIRASFAVEGMLLGILGAAIAYGLTLLGYVYLLAPAMRSLGFLGSIPMDYHVFLVPMAVAYGVIGLLVGLMGSVFSLRRHLKSV